MKISLILIVIAILLFFLNKRRSDQIFKNISFFILLVAIILLIGNLTGLIDIQVEGSSPPFFYSWSNGASTEDLSGLPAGEYTVTVTALY